MLPSLLRILISLLNTRNCILNSLINKINESPPKKIYSLMSFNEGTHPSSCHLACRSWCALTWHVIEVVSILLMLLRPQPPSLFSLHVLFQVIKCFFFFFCYPHSSTHTNLQFLLSPIYFAIDEGLKDGTCKVDGAPVVWSVGPTQRLVHPVGRSFNICWWCRLHDLD